MGLDINLTLMTDAKSLTSGVLLPLRRLERDGEEIKGHDGGWIYISVYLSYFTKGRYIKHNSLIYYGAGTKRFTENGRRDYGDMIILTGYIQYSTLFHISFTNKILHAPFTNNRNGDKNRREDRNADKTFLHKEKKSRSSSSIVRINKCDITLTVLDFTIVRV